MYSCTLSLTLALDDVGGQRYFPAALPPGKTRCQEVVWAPWPVWTGDKNLAHTGIQSPDRPARGKSLYRLSYPGPPCVRT
jgi:hypothetical protein